MSYFKRLLSKHVRKPKPSAKPFDLADHISQPITIHKMSEEAYHMTGFFDPKPQPYYGYKEGTWQKVTNTETTSKTFPTIKLLSWNIDFQAPASQARMSRALEYLHQLTTALPTSPPSIILLQEMTSSDLAIIQNTPWIQQTFHITDTTTQNWLSHYGTLTLIDRRLHIASVFRIHYASDMGRDALFVDIEDSTPTTLRFCNTHLESLAPEPPLRPAQVKLAARYLSDPTVDGGVIAGDFNAIQDFDLMLHAENGLRDAFLEGGGEEGGEEGWTWGMQSQYEGLNKFPPRRMDKVLCSGILRVQNLEKIGAGVRIEDSEGGQFVTDHLGLMTDVVVDEE